QATVTVLSLRALIILPTALKIKLSHTTATSAGRFYVERIKRGNSSRITTERGEVFMSRIFREMSRLCCTVHARPKAYYPQYDCFTEQLNHAISLMFAIFVILQQYNITFNQLCL